MFTTASIFTLNNEVFMSSLHRLTVTVTRHAADRIEALLHKLTAIEDTLVPSQPPLPNLVTMTARRDAAKRAHQANLRALNATDTLIEQLYH
jgi:hypothetical protein